MLFILLFFSHYLLFSSSLLLKDCNGYQLQGWRLWLCTKYFVFAFGFVFFLLVTHLFFYFNLTFLCCIGVIGVKRNNFPECSKNKHGNSLIPTLTCQFYFNVCVFTKMKSLFCCVLVTVSSFQ